MTITRPFLLSVLVALCPALGQKAPDFTLPDLKGDSVSLHDFRGKTMLLDFWVMWCETCREEVPVVQKIQDNYSGKGVAVLGIHLEEKNAGKVKSFVDNAGITYTVLLDPAEITADRFAIKGTPSVVIIDTSGAVVRKFRELDRKTEKEVYRVLDSLTSTLPAAPADQPENIPVKLPD
jgi:peroxiredoxin